MTVFPLPVGKMLQNSQWMPETMDSTKPSIYTNFFPVLHICDEV